ncbi:hypothetical protein KUTeg_014178 [Tegillarca granosa]|uniref:Uncharacterized protein n=1 Tax=Tegillarca granosa TaxID=220873 RepID=A0ABQ9EVV1_TEGGR|nr:hypothetical protein KUTeg_014178 [Tegillarca granosa]
MKTGARKRSYRQFFRGGLQRARGIHKGITIQRFVLTAFQDPLSQRRGCHFYINLTFEIFRFIFHDKGQDAPDGSKLFTKDDFNLLKLRKIGMCLFTRRMEKCQSRWSKKHFEHTKDKLIAGKRKPIELWKVDFCTRKVNVLNTI